MAVSIQTVKKCGFIRQIAEAAKRAGAVTLREQLLGAQTGHFTNTFSRGRLVVNQSGSGQSGSYEIGVQGKEWTQDNIFGLIEELIQLLDWTLANDDTLTDTPETIDALLAAIIDNLNLGAMPATGIRSQMGDCSCLNV